MKHFLALIVFLAVAFAVAAFGAQFQPGEWYAALEKPPWNPPNWVFGPVWTVLYVTIAVAAWLVWRRRGTGERRARTRFALGLWAVQLALNGLWSWLFFGLQRPGWALVDIVVLVIAIAWTARAFHRLVPAAGWLLIPYLAWVAYATTLNGAICWLAR